MREALARAARDPSLKNCSPFIRQLLSDLEGVRSQTAEAEVVVAKLREQLEQLRLLGEPPLQYGVFLGIGRARAEAQSEAPAGSGDAKATTEAVSGPVIAGIGGQKYEVQLAVAGLEAKDIREGQTLVLNKMMNVVGVRDQSLVGDTAEVVNVLTPAGSAVVRAIPEHGPLTVEGPDKTVVAVECPPDIRANLSPGGLVALDGTGTLAVGTAKPRLHVRSGGSEGIVVEVSDRLAAGGVAIGDIVRLDTRLQFAFEKLPAYETGGLTLEDVPDVTYDDVAGLDDQIAEIRDAIELPYLYGAIFDELRLTRPKGILLYGPPGCGKTMIAKAVANSLTLSIRAHLEHVVTVANRYHAAAGNDGVEAKRLAAELRAARIEPEMAQAESERIREVLRKNDGIRSYFLNVKGPELLNKYVGETEHRIRKVFEDAKRRASFYTPVVIFFDEMETMFRARGSGLSSDVETTIVPQFLSEMDGVEGAENVIVIGASNRPELIDPAILRPGRLDVKVKIDRPKRKAATAILALHLTPDLPMTSAGLTLDARDAHFTFSPQVVDRELRFLGRDLPAGRLDELRRAIPHRCDVRSARQKHGEALDAICGGDPAITAVLDAAVECEQRAEAMIERAVAILYDSRSRLEAVTATGKRYTYPLYDMVGGAVLASIVARAKKAALKRRVGTKDGDALGIGIEDLRVAIRDEFEGSKEQLVANRLETEIGGRPGQPVDAAQIVDLFLGGEEADPYLIEKVKVYRHRKVAS